LPTKFGQNFWDIIKTDLLDLFGALYIGQLELFILNFGKIILLSKVNEAERIQQVLYAFLMLASKYL
jgi:hypothetical protein